MTLWYEDTFFLSYLLVAGVLVHRAAPCRAESASPFHTVDFCW